MQICVRVCLSFVFELTLSCITVQLSLLSFPLSSPLQVLLQQVAARFGAWKTFLLQERSLCAAMNLMKQQGPTLVARFWVPTLDIPRVRDALEQVTAGQGLRASFTQVDTHDTPPTYFRTNEYASPCQPGGVFFRKTVIAIR
jgi:vacuolar-type H+-ATPase subunit I/STV1